MKNKPQKNSVQDQDLRKMLTIMIRIRLFEEYIFQAFKTEMMPGTIHQYDGMEGIAAGVACAINDNDLMTSTHRGHGHLIAKGCSINNIIAELYAKETGISRGVSGSMHMYDYPRGFLGTNGIVGGGVPIAVGAALAMKLENTNRIVICFLGDGATNEGAVHESMNLASIWRLPVLFIIENNQFAVSTSIKKTSNIEHLSIRSQSYGMPGITIDGNDAICVYENVQNAVDKTRLGSGPSIIECLTYRYKGHSRFEPAKYRDEKELSEWKLKDPIELLKNKLLSDSIINEKEYNEIFEKTKSEIEMAIMFAKESEMLTTQDLTNLVYDN